MKRFLKITSLTLVLLMLVGVFAACGNNNDKEDDTGSGTSDEVSTVEEDVVAAYPTHPEWEQTEFHFLTDAGYNKDRHFIDHEVDGDPIMDVSVARTLYIEENYKVDMIIHEEAYPINHIRNDFAAGGGSYDLIFPHPTSGMTALLAEGCFANFLDYSDVLTLDGAWYNSQQIDDYTVNGKLYLMVSDYTILGQGMVGLVYNKDMYANYGFDLDLYSLARNGQWTYETMLTLLKPFESVDDEDESSKVYGLTLHEGYLNSWTSAFGENTLVRNANGEYEMGYDTQRLSNIADSLYKLCWESHAVVRGVSVNSTYEQSVMFQTFKSGKALLTTYDIGGLYSLLRDVEFKIGILPTPKYDADQTGYRTMCASGGIALPAGGKDLEKSAIIFEALSRYSYRDLRPAYFEKILLGRLSESAQDYEMLEFIHNNKYFDIALTCQEAGDLSGVIRTVVIESQSKNVSGFLRRRANAVTTLVNFVNTIGADNDQDS